MFHIRSTAGETDEAAGEAFQIRAALYGPDCIICALTVLYGPDCLVCASSSSETPRENSNEILTPMGNWRHSLRNRANGSNSLLAGSI